MKPRDRILAKVHIAPNGCWVWTGGLMSTGYGSISIAGRTWLAHRAAYTLWVGPVPSSLELDHLCRTRSCCNPWHLEAVTHRVNAQRGDTGQHNAAKTHCVRGHPYDGHNVIKTATQRVCRTCSRERSARRREAATQQQKADQP